MGLNESSNETPYILGRLFSCLLYTSKWEELNEGGNLIFCMGMDYAQDDSDIKAAWENSIEANGERCV